MQRYFANCELRVQEGNNKNRHAIAQRRWQWVSRGSTSRFTRACCDHYIMLTARNVLVECKSATVPSLSSLSQQTVVPAPSLPYGVKISASFSWLLSSPPAASTWPFEIVVSVSPLRDCFRLAVGVHSLVDGS